MNAAAERKIVDYLYEAHALELALVTMLTNQIAMTPRGPFRDLLEAHLGETREHASRIEQHLAKRHAGPSVLRLGKGIVHAVGDQAYALSLAPFTMLRGSSGEEKLLKNAKDSCEFEEQEIATYLAIEELANELGDAPTAKLAASIRADEERMRAALHRQIPRLVRDVVASEIEGDPQYALTLVGAVDAARAVAGAAVSVAVRSVRGARETGPAPSARKPSAGRRTPAKRSSAKRSASARRS